VVSTTSTIERWPEQQTRGHTIPGSRYTSRDFMREEWEGMWTKSWLLLGREAELPNPGDWQMEELGPEEILMVRQQNDSVKAFYNVCQHRGNPLVCESKGSSPRRFVCKYHSWAFLPDGSLSFAPDKEDFPEGNPCGKIKLQELACETFAGFVWVNMDTDCKPLREFLGPIWDDWEAREIHTWKRTMANTMWLPCNWKVVLDNFNESYHVPTVHQGAKPGDDRAAIRSDINTYFKETRFDLADEGHNRMIMKGGYGSSYTDSDGNILEPLASLLRYWSLDPNEFNGRPEATREALQNAKRQHGRALGYAHYGNVPDEQLTDAFHYTLFPNFAVTVWADGFHFLRARPHRDDPEQCLFDNWWYGSPASIDAGLDPGNSATLATSLDGSETAVSMLTYGEDYIGPAIEDDVAIFVSQQRGFRSRGFKGVYLSNQEIRVRRYHEMIDDYIEGRLP
jgi:phenylpropionate dioxygenase-like ring-hydroxylating dioxygenase large terminal subunit